MAEIAKLKISKRDGRGTREARRLRKQGLTPGILYGHGEENLAFQTSSHDVELAIQHGERVLDLDIEGKSENALIKDVQYDTYGMEILHVDLTRVNLNETVEIDVPISLLGTPKGAEEGGVLQPILTELTVECMVRSIPDEIEIRVNDMEIGDTLTVADLELPDGVKAIDEPEAPVCSVTFITEEEVEEEPEEGLDVAAEPEVIGEKPEEDEEGEGGEGGEE